MFSFLILEIKSRRDYGYTYHKFLNAKNILTLSVIIVFIVTLVIRRILLNIPNEDLISQDASIYIDTWNIADDYISMYLVESLLFGLIIIKLLAFFDMNSTARLFYQSLFKTFQMFLKFLIILIITMAIFSAISHIIWGPYFEEFATLDISFVNILLMSIGYFDFSLFLHHEQYIAILFIGSFYLVLLTVVCSAFIAFYAEGLRLSVIKYGYPNESEENKWRLRDYINWIMNKKRKIIK
jgi:hypothetical protein